MDEQAKSVEQKPKKSSTGFILLVIIVVIIFAVYWWMQPTEETTNTTNQNVNVTNQNVNIANQNVNTTTTMTSSQVRSAFQAAVNADDHDTIATYLADTVHLEKEASGCCGDIDKATAQTQLTWVDNVTEFDFDQAQQIVVSMLANLADYFGGKTIGIADSREVFAYSLDANNKVNWVYLNIDHQTLDLE